MSSHSSPNRASRSPSYPSISLEDAIAKVQLVYKKESTHPADREVIAKDLGYNGINGASISVLSSLGKYDLLEPTGKGFKVSAIALDIILYTKGSRERANAVRQAALAPSLFSELHSQYGDTLPSDQNLRAYLVKRGFSEAASITIIRCYRATMEFLHDETQGSSIDDPNELIADVSSRSTINKSGGVSSPRIATSILPSEDFAPPDFVMTLKIAEDCEVQAAFRGHVTHEAIRKFIQHLELSLDVFPTKASLTRVVDHQEDDYENGPF
jgi:hypothetical protein